MNRAPVGILLGLDQMELGEFLLCLEKGCFAKFILAADERGGVGHGVFLTHSHLQRRGDVGVLETGNQQSVFGFIIQGANRTTIRKSGLGNVCIYHFLVLPMGVFYPYRSSLGDGIFSEAT